jgi:hypothetical protein
MGANQNIREYYGNKHTMSQRKLRPPFLASPIHTPFKLGDSVIVKAGTLDPDFNTDIGGWQGRITEIERDSDTGQTLLTIQWDSLTLKAIPSAAMEHSEEAGLDWTSMCLYDTEVAPVSPRDDLEDVAEMQLTIGEIYAWAYLGEQGRLIGKILQDAGSREMDRFAAWARYLEDHLSFPFEAKVSESQSRGPLRFNDQVTVKAIRDIEEMYGILVDVQVGKRKYVFPLCDLEALNQNSPLYELVDAYAVWFANR